MTKQSRWQLLDNIGKELTAAIKLADCMSSSNHLAKQALQDHLVAAKDLVNKLKTNLVNSVKKEVTQPL